MTVSPSPVPSYPRGEVRIKKGTNERRDKSVERWKFGFPLSFSLLNFSSTSSSTSFSSSFSFRSIYSAEEEAVERLVHFVHGTLHLVFRYYLTTVVTSSPELRYRPLCRYCAPEASGAKYKYKRLSDPAVKKNGVTLNVFCIGNCRERWTRSCLYAIASLPFYSWKENSKEDGRRRVKGKGGEKQKKSERDARVRHVMRH